MPSRGLKRQQTHETDHRLTLTRHQFETVRVRALESEFEEFLKGNDPISLEERSPTMEDLEDFELLKKFKLVSSDSTLDQSGYLVGESESKYQSQKLIRTSKTVI